MPCCCSAPCLGSKNASDDARALHSGTKVDGSTEADPPGHGAWMQALGRPSDVQVLDALPNWNAFYKDYVRANRPVVFKGAAVGQQLGREWLAKTRIEWCLKCSRTAESNQKRYKTINN